MLPVPHMDDFPATRCISSEAAPQTDEVCTAPLPGASLGASSAGALNPSQSRPFTQETTFGNFAQL